MPATACCPGGPRASSWFRAASSRVTVREKRSSS
jgi:hypothetical protein